MSNINYNNKTIAVDPANPTSDEKWTAANANEVKSAVNSKQDAESGKVLSTNDYTTTEKDKLADQSGTNTGDQDLSGLQQKETGKGLSTNDYTNPEKNKLNLIQSEATKNELATLTEVFNSINLSGWGDSLTFGQTSISYLANLNKLTGFQYYNGGISGQTSTQIRDRMLSDTEKLGFATIIWAGTNDPANGVSSAVGKQNIADMVTAIGHNRYLVVSVFNSSAEAIGNATYNTKMAFNADLASIYGERYIDVRGYLLTQGTGTGQDATDVNNGVIPTSLRGDAIHYNYLGSKKIADFIATKANILYGDSVKVITLNTATQLDKTEKKEVQLGTGGSLVIGGFPVLFFPAQESATNYNSLIIGNGGRVLTGISNLIAGMRAGEALTTANENVLLGTNAGNKATTALKNVGVGQHVFGNAIFTGQQNVALGNLTMYNALGASFNVVIGSRSGEVLTSGNGHVLIGYSTGNNLTTGGTCVIIGNNLQAPSATTSGYVSLANLFFGQGATGAGTTKAGTAGIGIDAKTTSMLSLPAGTATVTPLNIPDGVAPTSPQNGDVWFIGDVMYRRINGVTKSLTFA